MYSRIKKNSQFNLLFSKGKKAFSPALILLYLSNEITEVGICVSKKHGNAVQRNRIKRLIRAALMQNVKDLKSTYSMVFIAKQADEYSLQNFLKSLHFLFKKEGLL